MRMFNADGSEAEMCGNGVRCLAKYAFDHGLTKANPMRVETVGGVKEIELTIGKDGKVNAATVDMGEPILDPPQIPVNIPQQRIVESPIRTSKRAFENYDLASEKYGQVNASSEHACYIIKQQILTLYGKIEVAEAIGEFDISTKAADLRNELLEKAQECDPDFSPDFDPATPGYQGMLAFRAAPETTFQTDIWLLDLEIDQNGQVTAGGLTNLTDSPEYQENPAWSPDGEFLAYTVLLATLESDIVVVDLTKFCCTDRDFLPRALDLCVLLGC